MLVLKVCLHTPKEQKHKPKHKQEKNTKSKHDPKVVPKCPFRLHRSEIVNLPDIEVQMASTLMELRVMLHANPLLSHAPSPYHIRISRVDSYMQPGKILKKNGQHIKYSGLKNGTKILIQILTEEEKLPEKSILFRIVKRNCETHSYDTPTQPFLFQQRNLCNLGALKYQVQTMFEDIPVPQMALAWYQMHLLSWKEVKMTRRRKKKRRKKNTVLAELSQLPDHTVLAVKNTLHDPKGVDNFRSKYDVYMRRLNRNANHSGSSDPVINVPALKINVQWWLIV